MGRTARCVGSLVHCLPVCERRARRGNGRRCFQQWLIRRCRTISIHFSPHRIPRVTIETLNPSKILSSQMLASAHTPPSQQASPARLGYLSQLSGSSPVLAWGVFATTDDLSREFKIRKTWKHSLMGSPQPQQPQDICATTAAGSPQSQQR